MHHKCIIKEIKDDMTFDLSLTNTINYRSKLHVLSDIFNLLG